MEGIDEDRANVDTHKEFGEVLEEAKHAGVKIIFIGCNVGEDYLEVGRVISL